MSDTVERVAQWIAKNLMRYAWDGLSEGRCGEQFPPWTVGGHGNARKENYRDAARAALAIPLNEVLAHIAEEERRVVSPEAAGALANIKNAIGAMMEEGG